MSACPTQVGANTIEHGNTRQEPFDGDTLALMKEKDVTYVPTLAVSREGVRNRLKRHLLSVHTAGVRIAAGTDAQGPNMTFGNSLHEELTLLAEAGLTGEEALLAATRNAAIAMGAEAELGTLEPGKLADLLLVTGKPWEKIEALRGIVLVIQNGRIVVDKRTVKD